MIFKKIKHKTHNFVYLTRALRFLGLRNYCFTKNSNHEKIQYK